MLLVVPPPTPNGGLHLGHLSGPYLYADVCRRWERLNGREAAFWIHADSNQSYCVTAAQRKGEPTASFVKARCAEIEASLRKSRIEFAGFSDPQAPEYNSFVRSFFGHLLNLGALKRKSRPFFVDSQTGQPYADALIAGRCGQCLAACAGGICEVCGSPNDPVELGTPHVVGHPTPIHTENFEVLVLELEPHREALRQRLLHSGAAIRPRLRVLLTRLLSGCLPDIAITQPAAWGCSTGVAGFDGQVFNPWAEILPGHIFFSQNLAPGLRWSAEHGPALFFGFDNSFFYALVHGALLLASEGRWAFPTHFITNEFYELDGAKFSSSTGHAVWVDEGLQQFGVDSLRFYLSLTNPAYQRSNFSMNAATESIASNLREPLTRIVRARDKLQSLKSSPETWRRHCLDSSAAHIASLYDLEAMDLPAIAAALTRLLRFLADEAEAAEQCGDGSSLVEIDTGLAYWAQLAIPIMPDVGSSLVRALVADQDDGPIRLRSHDTLRQSIQHPDLRAAVPWETT